MKKFLLLIALSVVGCRPQVPAEVIPPVYPMTQSQAPSQPTTPGFSQMPVIDRGAWVKDISRITHEGLVVSFQAVITAPETMARVIWQVSVPMEGRRIVGVDRQGVPVVTVWESLNGARQGGADTAMRSQLERVYRWVIA